MRKQAMEHLKDGGVIAVFRLERGGLQTMFGPVIEKVEPFYVENDTALSGRVNQSIFLAQILACIKLQIRSPPLCVRPTFI